MSTMRFDLAALNPTMAAGPTLSARRLARRRLRGGERCGLRTSVVQVVLGQRRLDPRDEIAAVRFVIDVLSWQPPHSG